MSEDLNNNMKTKRRLNGKYNSITEIQFSYLPSSQEKNNNIKYYYYTKILL